MFFARNLELMYSHEQGKQLFITVFIQCTDTLLFHAKTATDEIKCLFFLTLPSLTTKADIHA